MLESRSRVVNGRMGSGLGMQGEIKRILFSGNFQLTIWLMVLCRRVNPSFWSVIIPSTKHCPSSRNSILIRDT